ncbi:MAG: hypothetical protein LBU25_02795 [Treponema sp.]|jgi:hypothetical protein|nr:hypothetical protein [Treponema sp.]
MNPLTVRFFLMVLAVLYILYSQYNHHTFCDTRTLGVIGHSYREIRGIPLYLSRRIYTYREGVIQHVAQSVELTLRALYNGPSLLASY